VKVAILDYGMCNLLNVARAFEAIGADVRMIDSAAEASSAERLVVPGVGAFEDSITEVRARGFDEAICQFIATGRPFLGVCVGMQMLFEWSEEFGEHQGLGILAGRVKAVPRITVDGSEQRVPHIGWNSLLPSKDSEWHGTLLEPFKGQTPEVYFVHSFVAQPEHTSDRLADCDYGGHRLCAAVSKDNILATQFHPERSAETGLQMLRAFLRL
jgi:glutamine amidotransferase